MDKISITIDNLLGLSSNLKTKAKNYEPVLARHRRNRWVYRVGDYLVRLRIIKIPYSISRKMTPAQLKKEKKIKDRDVYVSCTCDFWKWGGPDFNANEQDYSERSFSDLSSPDIRDPQRENLICKHVYAALKKFKKDFKQVP